MNIIKALFVLIFLYSPFTIASPSNSIQFGNTWFCKEGYSRQGDSCIKINPPTNAYIMGNSWHCKEGYKRVGESCQALQVPPNAYIMGNMWICNEGYERKGNSCAALKVPDNAYVMGNMWACNEGYKRSGDSCKKLTSEEINQRNEILKIIAAQREELRRKGASGDICETEYDTGASVCLTLDRAKLDCEEDYSGNYYDECSVDIGYQLETDYRGRSSINVEISCEADISYKSRNRYNSSESESYYENHSLSSYDSTSSYAELDFSFSSYDEIYSVSIDDAYCEIQSVELD